MKTIAQQEITAAEIDVAALDPAFRRASLNMVMATLNCERILKVLPPETPKENISFVVATHFGEVSTTLEFLSTYYETNVARPILFQNSLHNSTLGFVSIHLGLKGPAMTVSCDQETQASAMQVCEALLGTTRYALLCIVDSVPKSLTKFYLETYPFMAQFLDRSICYLFERA